WRCADRRPRQDRPGPQRRGLGYPRPRKSARPLESGDERDDAIYSSKLQLFRALDVDAMSRFPKGTPHSMRVQILATISLGLLSAACQGTYSQNAPGAAAPAYGNAYQSSSAACLDYGFPAGTTSFNQCVAREQQARAAGRVNRDYAATQLTADARGACSSYGLAAGTASYDRCVSREVDARTYRDAAAQPGPAYYTDQNGNRVDAQGYRVDANGYRIAGQASPYSPSARSEEHTSELQSHLN